MYNYRLIFFWHYNAMLCSINKVKLVWENVTFLREIIN